MNWLKYSGIWFGVVVNPYHWKFKWERTDHVDGKPVAPCFENCVFVGPVWIRVIIDDGKW